MVAALLLAAFLGWLGWMATTSARHDAALGHVLDEVSALNDRTGYSAVDSAVAAYLGGSESAGADVERLLGVLDVDQTGRTQPVEISRPANAVVSKYEVTTSYKVSCVISVLKPGGYRVESIPQPCASGYVPPDLFGYIAAG